MASPSLRLNPVSDAAELPGAYVAPASLKGSPCTCPQPSPCTNPAEGTEERGCQPGGEGAAEPLLSTRYGPGLCSPIHVGSN